MFIYYKLDELTSYDLTIYYNIIFSNYISFYNKSLYFLKFYYKLIISYNRTFKTYLYK